MPGLRPGELLLPRRDLAQWRADADRWVQHPRSRPGHPDPAHTVSITTDPWAALSWADDYREPWPAMQKALGRPGTLYLVAPVLARDLSVMPSPRLPHAADQLLVDPDFADYPGQFARVPQAVVLEVIREHVELSERDFVRHLGAYQAWGPQDPVYSAEGLLRPSPSMRAAGCTPAHLTEHGAWVPLSSVHEYGSPMRLKQGWTLRDERLRASHPRRESLQLAGAPLGRFGAPATTGLISDPERGPAVAESISSRIVRRRWLRRR